jgi:CelD/BcsL family acetyltransferase involved in cellulose biosynthesis
MSGRVHVIDPLTDNRWVELVERHPQASVFHSRGWLDALRRTYGYEPYALTTSANGPLQDGLVVCRVKTWLARRLVSLPFTDHCDPLVDRPEEVTALGAHLRDDVAQGGWRSAEVRSRGQVMDGFSAGSTYCLHTVDLTGSSEQVFGRFHPSSTQRAIRRAEREGLRYETGVSEPLLARFYGLLRLTRRRHGLPPQPFTWFRNLAACLGNALAIHLASKDNRPVAALLTISFRKTMVYKYGGSDAAQHKLGGMPFLFWRAIQEAQSRGIEELDLGRSDLDQPGLIAFKDHLGAQRSALTYSQTPAPRRESAAEAASPLASAARRVVSRLPDPLLDLTGRLVYRHLG